MSTSSRHGSRRRDCHPQQTSTAAVRNSVLVECTDDPAALRLKTIIRDTHKLTHDHGRDEGEFYDLIADPGEVRNRWTDPQAAPAREKPLRQLVDHAEPLERRVPRSCYA